MQLSDQQLLKLWYLQRKLLDAIVEGKGARISHRSSRLEFKERDAMLLDLTHLPDSPLFVYGQVRIVPSRVLKWGAPIAHDDEFFHGRFLPLDSPQNIFRIVAFVRVLGEVNGGMRCEGMFCVLSQPDWAHTIADDTGKFDQVERICRGEEVGREKGKVMLYPIECLVPVSEQTHQAIRCGAGKPAGLDGRCFET